METVRNDPPTEPCNGSVIPDFTKSPVKIDRCVGRNKCFYAAITPPGEYTPDLDSNQDLLIYS